jgi:hypothetical protein
MSFLPAATTAQTPGSLNARDVTVREAVPSISGIDRTIQDEA